jgi:ABC-2 type transport system permease protein
VSLREWIPVARWELTRMLTRADFLISTLTVPALALGAGFVGDWINRRGDAERHRVAIVQPAGAPIPPLARIEWVLAPAAATPESLRQMVEDRTVDAAVVVPDGWLAGDSVRAFVRRGTPGWIGDVRTHLSREARLRRAAAHGLDSTTLASFDDPVTWSERSAVPARTSRGDRVLALGVLALTIMSIFVTGMYMAIGIAGEKQQRVTEVVVSAIRPQAWMDGKIVAYATIGLLQTALWGVSMGAIAGMMGAAMGWTFDPWLSARVLAFAALGFVLYCALFALVMATVKDLQSTQKFQAYLIFLPAIPFVFAEASIRTPDAPWVVALSHVPFFSPMLMPLRMLLGATHAWEAPVGIAVLIVTTLLVRRAAGEAFRIGMLMYGKELTLPELWRWAREG